MSNGYVPIECVACGFSLGSGFPGSTYFCSKCQNYVASKASTGNLGAAIGAIAVVGFFVLVGALIATALSD